MLFRSDRDAVNVRPQVTAIAQRTGSHLFWHLSHDTIQDTHRQRVAHAGTVTTPYRTLTDKGWPTLAPTLAPLGSHWAPTGLKGGPYWPPTKGRPRWPRVAPAGLLGPRWNPRVAPAGPRQRVAPAGPRRVAPAGPRWSANDGSSATVSITDLHAERWDRLFRQTWHFRQFLQIDQYPLVIAQDT